MLDPSRKRFIEEFAQLIGPWRGPATAARLMGYLMITEGGATLDQIAEDLEMSRAGAWTAARYLEQQGSVRRYSERGSKRVYFKLSNELAPYFMEQLRMLGSLGKLMENMAAVEEGKIGERMKLMANHCFHFEEMVAAAVQKYEQEKEQAGLQEQPLRLGK